MRAVRAHTHPEFHYFPFLLLFVNGKTEREREHHRIILNGNNFESTLQNLNEYQECYFNLNLSTKFLPFVFNSINSCIALIFTFIHTVRCVASQFRKIETIKLGKCSNIPCSPHNNKTKTVSLRA